jgi:hypothetical protein
MRAPVAVSTDIKGALDVQRPDPQDPGTPP